jgi:hypothetical protein
MLELLVLVEHEVMRVMLEILDGMAMLAAEVAVVMAEMVVVII